MNSINSLVKPQFSVIICTYNRADLLRIALNSLVAQTLEPSQFEVIVVDNNATDHTESVVNEFTPEFQFRCVREPNQGLSHARNRGWREAKGDYVVYLDDDGFAPPQWLAVGISIATECHPIIFGGPVKDYFVSKRPQWFLDDYLFFTSSKSRTAGPLGIDEWLFGGNLFVKTTVVRELGGFPAELQMSGEKLAYGDETHVVNLARRHYPDQLIYFDPALFIYHLFRPEKMKLTWMLRSRYQDGKCVSRQIHMLHNAPSVKGRLRAAVKILYAALVNLLNILVVLILWTNARYRRFPSRRSYVIYRTLSFISVLGMSAETMSFRAK